MDRRVLTLAVFRGHPLWHVAPIEMAWEGKSLGEICQQIKYPKRNGGKTMEELGHHMAEDSLVGWGWVPGAGREPAPGTQKEFVSGADPSLGGEWRGLSPLTHATIFYASSRVRPRFAPPRHYWCGPALDT